MVWDLLICLGYRFCLLLVGCSEVCLVLLLIAVAVSCLLVVFDLYGLMGFVSVVVFGFGCFTVVCGFCAGTC